MVLMTKKILLIILICIIILITVIVNFCILLHDAMEREDAFQIMHKSLEVIFFDLENIPDGNIEIERYIARIEKNYQKKSENFIIQVAKSGEYYNFSFFSKSDKKLVYQNTLQIDCPEKAICRLQNELIKIAFNDIINAPNGDIDADIYMSKLPTSYIYLMEKLIINIKKYENNVDFIFLRKRDKKIIFKDKLLL